MRNPVATCLILATFALAEACSTAELPESPSPSLSGEAEAPERAAETAGAESAPPMPEDSATTSTEDPETLNPARGAEAQVEEPPEAEPGTSREPVGIGISDRTPLVLNLEPASGGAPVKVGLNLVDTTLESVIALDCVVDGVEVSLLRYVPSLVVREFVAPADEGEPGPPAIRLEIKTARRKWDTWLVPGSRVLGRASLRSAWIEYLPEQPVEERRETEEFLLELYNSEPKIVLEVKRDGRRFLFPASEGSTGGIENPECRIEVLRSLTCFALDPDTGEPINQDPRPLNPAVQVRITRPDGVRTAWLFSHLPEFSRGAMDEETALRYLWNTEGHPHGRADVTILDCGDAPLRAHAAVNGSRIQFELKPRMPVDLSALTISLLERLPSARIGQKVLPGGEEGVPAVLVAWKEGAVQKQRWIPQGTTEEIRAGDTILWGRLEQHAAPGAGGAARAHGGSAPSLGMPLDHPPLPDPVRKESDSEPASRN